MKKTETTKSCRICHGRLSGARKGVCRSCQDSEVVDSAIQRLCLHGINRQGVAG